MAEDKKFAKAPEFNTPRATWKFPKLDKCDYGNKKFPKPNGEYSVQVVMQADAPVTKAFIEKLTPLYKEAEEAAAAAFKELKVETRKKLEKSNGKQGFQMNDLFSTTYDQETEKPTGEIVFKFAMPASGESERNGKKTKWSRKPAIMDAKGVPMVKVPEIWGGSEGIVRFAARPYFIPGTGAAGLKLALVAAQLLKLVQGGQRDAAGYGFGVEEGGYEHSDTVGDDDTTEEENSDGDDTTSDDATEDKGDGDF